MAETAYGIKIEGVSCVKEGHAIAVWLDGSYASSEFDGSPRGLAAICREQPRVCPHTHRAMRRPGRPVVILCHPSTKAAYAKWVKDQAEKFESIVKL